MDIEAEVEMHNAIFYGGADRPVGVQVTVQSNWFRINNMRNKKPAASQVAKYWAEMQKAEDSLSINVQLHLIKRAMLEWPKMGAAIAKLAQKEYLRAKKEAKAFQRRRLNKYKKMLREPVPEMHDIDHANRGADHENFKRKNAVATARVGQKVSKK
jgi:hypothetical protein